MPQQPENRACWEKPPYTCPVRAPLMLAVAGKHIEVTLGAIEGAQHCARVLVGGRTFGEGAHCESFADAAEIALHQLEARIRTDLAVGAIVRALLKRKPWLSKIAEVIAEVLLREMNAEEQDVMRSAMGEFTGPSR